MNTRFEVEQHLCIVIHRPEDATLVKKSGLVGALNRQIRGAQMGVNTPHFPEDAVELAVLAPPSNVCSERMSLTRFAWDTLLEEGDMSVLKREIKWGALLDSAVAAQLEIVKNFYEHSSCDTSWNDTWSCGCDDECPKCGTSISPVQSVPERMIVQDERGVWDLVEMQKKELKLEITMDIHGPKLGDTQSNLANLANAVGQMWEQDPPIKRRMKM